MDDSLPIEIDVKETNKLLESGEIVLVDCREESEWETARIEGARLLPMSQWADLGDKLAELSGKRIVVHCHHGGRSMRVTNWMRENGFPNTQNMAGGIDAWSQEIDTSVDRY
ncbi:MAG: rhodanese-like domain-containing protein [Aureliella sp.]